MKNNIYDFSDIGISKLIEQMQQISQPLIEMINSIALKTSIQPIIQQCTIQNEIMQEYLKNNIIESVIKPNLELYTKQLKIISEDIIPKVITPNICNTLLLYKNVLDEINFNNLKIDHNGTIEYEGNVFQEDEIEESSTELIKEIGENKNLKIDTILKKILLSFFVTFATFFMSGNDLEWIFIAIASGFFGQIGADMFDFFRKKFFTQYECEEKDKNNYFKEYSAIVKLEELKVRKKPSSNEKIIGFIYFLQLVRILDIKPYWVKVEYKDKENKISISGWVSKKGLKRFNTLTSQFEDICDENLGV